MTNGSSIRTILVTGAALGTINLSAIPAQAGGFYLHAQSAYFLGTSFAGAAAGGPSLSAMFWNPATITQHGPGLTSEIDGTAVFPKIEIAPITATTPSGLNLAPFGGSGDIATDAFIPASYLIYGLTDRISFGMGLNSAFGLNTKAGPLWAGMFYGTESDVFSINANPSIGFKVTDWLSVGVGAQIQYFKVKLHSLFPGSGVTGPFPLLAPIVPDQLRIEGDSWDFGLTAGITIMPTRWTTIGLGYRSRIDHSIEGDIFRPAFSAPVVVPPIGLVPVAFPAEFVNFTADIPLPDVASASIRQKFTEAFTLLGTVEWSNWSRLKRVPVTTFPVGPIPGAPTELAFEWRDGWMASVGAEYEWNPKILVRAGIAFEKSPIDDRARGTRLPDNDRLWVGAGMSYKWSDNLTFELAYSHIFYDETPISITAASANPSFNAGLGSFVGTANSQVDLLSLAIRYRFAPATAAAAPIITKG